MRIARLREAFSPASGVIAEFISFAARSASAKSAGIGDSAKKDSRALEAP